MSGDVVHEVRIRLPDGREVVAGHGDSIVPVIGQARDLQQKLREHFAEIAAWLAGHPEAAGVTREDLVTFQPPPADWPLGERGAS